VTCRALQKRLKEWLNLDPTFANFHYLGKHRPAITLDEFAERLYDAIGFLGRNFRFRDSERFWNLRYFVPRYITEATLKLELKFIPHSIEAIIIDTMGIEGRKKSILATYQGRHHIIGQADLRAVSIDMLPLRSGGCRSTDSEAMNIVEIMKDVQ